MGPLIFLFWTSGEVCPRFQSQGRSTHLHALSPLHNGILRFTSGAIPAVLIYRPQTKFAKVMFLHVSVCPRGVGGIPVCIAGGIPVCLAGIRGVVSQHALRQTPLADGYCCGRYASYWNAFLFTY